MSNYTNSLNELINTKKEIKDIIIESTGENPSEVFSYYPSYIRSAIAAGSGDGSISEEAVNSYISAYLSAYNYIDQDTLSSNSYITMGDVSACGYITSHQDLSSYATKSYVVDYVATYAPTPDLSSYVTKTELSAQSYITMGDVSACGYITSSDIPAAPDLSSYATKSELHTYISAELFGYPIGTEARTLYSGGLNILTDGKIVPNEISYSDPIWTNTGNQYKYYWVGSATLKNYVNGRLSEIESSYVSYTYLASKNYLTEHQDLSSYVSKTELSNQSYITLADIPSVDLSSYVTYTYLESKHYLTEHQDLSSYVTQTALEGMSYISMTDVSACGYITMNDVSACGYITSSDIPSVVVPVIDEDLIPKETGTYTLGTLNKMYAATYTAKISASNNGLWIDNGGTHKYFAGSTSFRPYTNNGFTLGVDTIRWSSTYSYNYYLGYNVSFDSASDYNMNININGARRFYCDTQTFTGTGTNKNLGTTNTPFAYTYTTNLILNGTDIKTSINGMFSYDSTTGILTITSLS